MFGPSGEKMVFEGVQDEPFRKLTATDVQSTFFNETKEQRARRLALSLVAGTPELHLNGSRKPQNRHNKDGERNRQKLKEA
jgi:hypothetical protein